METTEIIGPKPVTQGDDTIPAVVVSTPFFPQVPGYELLELVGRGGMGRVYKARHLKLGRMVALKFLSGDADERLLARFREEARSVARLQHPNIAALYETGSADGQPYFAQEFLDGGSLARKISGQPQPAAPSAALVVTIARAIHHSHSEGILHRDLKPANILLAGDGTPKVVDFGLAKPIANSGDETRIETGNALTRTGEVLGTPSYMAPEQATGVVARLTAATDVYALGAILYEMLTGRPPFQSPDAMQTLLLVLTTDPLPPRMLQPGLPVDLETICLKCLEKEPARRYASAADLADDLQRFLAGEPIRARPLGPVGRTWKWAKRRPTAAALIGVSGLLVMVLIAAVIVFAAGVIKLRGALHDVEVAKHNLEVSNQQLEQSNRDLTAARDEIEQTLGLTLSALDRYFFEFSDRLKDLPEGEDLRLEVLTGARHTLDALAQFRPSDPKIQTYRMRGYDRLANIYLLMGKASAAEADYVRARDIALDLQARFPEDSYYRRSWALAVAKIADIERRRGKVKSADELLDRILPVLNEQSEETSDPRSLEFQAVVRLQLFERELRRQNWSQAETLMRQLCALDRKLVAADSDNPQRKLAVIDGDRRLAVLLMDLDKVAEADPILRKAAASADELPNRDAPPVRKLRAAVQRTLGDFEEYQKRHGPAIAAYESALAEYQSLARRFPKSPLYRYEQASVLYRLMTPTALGGDVAGGIRHLETAEKMLDDLTREYPMDTDYRELHSRVSQLLKKIRNPAKAVKVNK